MSQHFILIVDDEPHVLSAFLRALRKEPYQLITAPDAQEALKILEARDISLVVSDYNMPGMNGIEFLKQVRTRFPHILTIMLTGQAELEIAVQAINEVGIYKFIQKPWINEDLKMTLLRALESIDLATQRDRLVQKIKTRDAIIQELERQFPGITKVNRDEEGYMVMED
jgi:two-component system probable response regulator PhcQ